MSTQSVRATYLLQSAGAAAERRAQALALEQSIEMPLEAVRDERIVREVIARVESVEQVEAGPDGASIARVALSAESIGADPGQLLNMIFGNSSLLDDARVLDIELPASLCARLGGPSLGIDGLRRLTGAVGRALSCTALKPIGSSIEDLVRMTRVFCRAGIDVVKDDHGWAADARVPFRERVVACQRVVEAEGRGRTTRTLYAPAVCGSLDAMREQLRFAQSEGVAVALLMPMLSGVSNFHALRREFPSMALLAHPALAGNQFAPQALLGSLFRLFGADAVIFPNHGGRFSYSREQCAALAARLREPMHGLRPSLPVPAGGMTVERVPELLAEYGRDVMLLIGGSLLIAREDLAARSAAFVEAVARAGCEAEASCG
jgi:ribulose-bisphosphate carboxylase large chain